MEKWTEELLDKIKHKNFCGIRPHGGTGFPTGRKMDAMRKTTGRRISPGGPMASGAVFSGRCTMRPGRRSTAARRKLWKSGWTVRLRPLRGFIMMWDLCGFTVRWQTIA